MKSAQTTPLHPHGSLTTIEILESRIAPAKAFAVLGANLASFDTATPGTLDTNVAISGLGAGETIAGIDFRPSTGDLFALTIDAAQTGKLYKLNTSTAVATLVSTVSVPLAGTDFGIDFNPVVDRLRVVSDADQNLRINVDTGAATIDVTLNPGNPNNIASAYTNSFVGPTSTTLFGIDSATDTLVIQNPPNNGTLTSIGDLGVNTSSAAAFDIATAGDSGSPTNTGFAVLTVGGVHGLYSINLTSGAASLVGAIPGGTAVRGFSLAPAGTFRFTQPTYNIGESGPFIAIGVDRVGGATGTVSAKFVTVDGTAIAGSDFQAQSVNLTFLSGAIGPATIAIPITNDVTAEDIEAFKVVLQNPSGGVVLASGPSSVIITDDEVAPANAFAVDAEGNLLRFNSATPGTIVSTNPITGLGVGEALLGIDFRPNNGLLYAVTNGGSGQLYTIDVTTAVATPLLALTADPADTTDPFAGLTGGTFGVDFNPVVDRLRIVSDTGQNLRINVDTGRVTTDAALNGGANGANGSAYSNDFAGTSATTLFAIDSQSDSLFTQNPPNNGTLALAGALGVDATGQVSFDIRSQGGANAGFATLTVGNVTGLFSINLATGSATLLGAVGTGTTGLLGFSLAPTQFTATIAGSTATFTGSAASDSITFDQSGGLLKHNRFSAGDSGFNSDFDFDSAAAGDQTLAATSATTVTINGAEGNDSISVGGNTSSLLGGVNFVLRGGSGADRLAINANGGAGNVTVDGGSGTDTIDFSNSSSGVTFHYDLLNTPIAINGTSLRLTVSDDLESFVGTALNDTIFDTAGFASHLVVGGGQTSPSGDTLFFDALGRPTSITRTQFNSGAVLPTGYVSLNFDDVETVRLLSSPSATFGGLGNPATAFSGGSLYDVSPAKSPVAVATGDLNGDGFADLVSLNAKSNSISVLLNRGDGTFDLPVQFATGGKKSSDFVLGDFNGDNFVDVAALNSGSANVSLLQGDGSGGFGDAQLFKVAAKPAALASGLINGDGIPDLAVAHSKGGVVSILLGTASGFDTPTTFKTGGSSSSDIAVGDVNQDGFADVVTANTGSSDVSFLAGDGTGDLQDATRFAAGVQPSKFALADIDLDGSLDLAVVHKVSRFVSVLYGRGSSVGAQFESQIRLGLPASIQPAAIAAADISGDGFSDLVLASSTGGSVNVLLGLSRRSFSTPVRFDLGDDVKGTAVTGLAIADLDNDSLLDIVTTVPKAGEVRTLLRQPVS